MAFSFDTFGNNRSPSAAEREALQEAINKSKDRLLSVENDLWLSEEEWRAAHKGFEDAKVALEDAELRLSLISSLRDATSSALTAISDFELSEDVKGRLERTTTTAADNRDKHLAIANKVVEQQEETKKALTDRISVLETAKQEAQAGVVEAGEVHQGAQVRLSSVDEVLRMYRDQKVLLEASMQAKRQRLLSPAIKRLPNEVWLQIFRFVACSPPKLFSGVYRKSVMVIPALNLTRVCQSWNGIVTSNPSLWGYLYIKSLSLDGSQILCLKHCLGHIDKSVSILHIQISGGSVAQAEVLSDAFRHLSIRELQIHPTVNGIKAAAYLINQLPTPTILRVRSEDTQEQQRNLRLMLAVSPRNPERLVTVTMHNAWIRSPVDQYPYRSVANLFMTFHHRPPTLRQINTEFSNVTTITLTGSNRLAKLAMPEGLLTFSRLKYLASPICGLVNGFDASCQLPALREISTWVVDSKLPGMDPWIQFLTRNKLQNRLESIEIRDMHPTDAESIVEYVRELLSVPRMTIVGRSVDALLQNLLNPNCDEAGLGLQIIAIRDYPGDGMPVLKLVTRYNSWSSSQALRIEDVLWTNCCNVTSETRKQVEEICQG